MGITGIKGTKGIVWNCSILLIKRIVVLDGRSRESVPKGIKGIKGIKSIHIWKLSSTEQVVEKKQASVKDEREED